MFLSDVNLDLNYTVGSSTVCTDDACCHSNNIPTSKSQYAGSYGNQNCYFNVKGFQKMIDTINTFNKSYLNFKSIIYAGSS